MDNNSNDTGEVATNNNILPPELLENIFCHLSGQKDLSTVMLVCKTWNNVAEAPVFWSWFKIKKPCQLTLKRLQGCQQIVIGESWSRDKEGKITNICWTRTFQEILQHPGLKKITLHQGWLICKELIPLQKNNSLLTTQILYFGFTNCVNLFAIFSRQKCSMFLFGYRLLSLLFCDFHST